jgi:hypothetical protein
MLTGRRANTAQVVPTSDQALASARGLEALGMLTSRKSRRLSLNYMEFEDYEDPHEEEEHEKKMLLQRYRDYINNIESRFNYQDAKDWVRWFLDTATINVPLNVSTFRCVYV